MNRNVEDAHVLGVEIFYVTVFGVSTWNNGDVSDECSYLVTSRGAHCSAVPVLPSFVLYLFGTMQYTCTISVSKHLEVLAGTCFAVLVSAENAMAPDGSGETRCRICERIGHAHPQCTLVVTLVAAPNSPLHVYFDAGLLPPRYHYTDYSRVLTSTVCISTTTELGH